METKSEFPESVGVLKRKTRSTNFNLCVFCQKKKGEPLRNSTIAAKQKVMDCITKRWKNRDGRNIELLDRLHEIDDVTWKSELKTISWHKNCYSSFTSITNIRFLETRGKKCTDLEGKSEHDKISSSVAASTRYKSIPVDWGKCMFCQTVGKGSLHVVQTLEKSSKILQLSKTDHNMSVRLSSVHDLVAVEGKYHLKCLIKFERNSKNDENNTTKDVMTQLCTNLNDGLASGNIYDMGKVWRKYVEMSYELESEIPARYESRRQYFYQDIKQQLGDKASFIRPAGNRCQSLLLYPGDKSEFVISHSLNKNTDTDLFANSDSESSSDELLGNESFSCNMMDGFFQKMVHVALQIRSDLEQSPGHDLKWRHIDHQHVESVIPNSLYLFLSLVFGGSAVIDEVSSTEKCIDDEQTNRRILSVAQDIVFGVSKGRKLTPKHVGLGLSLHQATRSEKLVDLFHAANHCISIQTIRKFDNGIANQILDHYKENGYVYIPPNIISNVFTHFSCDNIDVLEATLDGKNTFHSTQMIAWQRQTVISDHQRNVDLPDNIVADKEIMKVYQKIEPAKLPIGKRSSPNVIAHNIDINNWFKYEDQTNNAKLINLVWTIARQNFRGGSQSIPLWGSFNEQLCSEKRPLTKACMLPILAAPADEYDTIMSIIKRFMGISNFVGQTHTVITADQPLYSKAKELVWANPNEFSNVILMMGGLHICFNFLRVIGQHMEYSGLEDIWVEAGVFGTNTIGSVLDGKAYYRAVRGHILTYEALCRLKWRYFEAWLTDKAKIKTPSLKLELDNLQSAFLCHPKQRGDIQKVCDDLSKRLGDSGILSLLQQFEQEMMSIKNFAFWHSYLRLVEILLFFIKAQRLGDWALHVETFASMLPWMAIYDHTNYARWGPVYLYDMKTMNANAPDVLKEFKAGNFVVKRSNNYFNEVPTDQATEWINKVCKTAGGIIGITRQDQARDRFCITWSQRSQITNETLCLFGLQDDEEEIASNRTDAQKTRITSDEKIINLLCELFGSSNVFGISSLGFDLSQLVEDKLISIASKDVATDIICKDLLTCEQRGQNIIEEFTKTRLVEKNIDFFAPIKRHKSQTFAHLYKTMPSEKNQTSKLIKADRKLLQRLFNAANAGRCVQIAEVLKHELSPIPLSLASSDGSMNKTTKSQILNVLTTDQGIIAPTKVPNSEKPTCVIIDGHALIQSLGKPEHCQTFGDYADKFVKSVFSHFGEQTTRVDVTFDRYLGCNSTKAFTRTKRIGKRRPIRKQITCRQVPLPQVWDQYITLADNKADLAEFLSSELMQQGNSLPFNYSIVAGGGFSGDINARANNFNAESLSAKHEEADTRIIIHLMNAVEKGYQRLLVTSRDTDVLLLLIYNILPEIEIWMVSGTSRQRRCYPVHSIAEKLGDDIRRMILGFHALTGCDTTSSFHGFSKKTCWKIFVENPSLFSTIGHNEETESIERFLCTLYGCSPENQHSPDVDLCRYRLFMKAKKSLDLLPPTKDALQLHVQRASYQAEIWMNAANIHFEPKDPVTTGSWAHTNDTISPVWIRKPPIPSACLQLVTCGCRSKCNSARCKCYKAGQVCMFECGCEAQDCANPV